MERTKQAEAARHIKELLAQRGINISSRNLTLEDNQKWILFEQKGLQVGIDTASGIWIRSSDSDWRCISMPCTVGGALQAVEFLTSEVR
jgi:hypothetical protein